MLLLINSAYAQSYLDSYSELIKKYNGSQLNLKIDSLIDHCDQSGKFGYKAEICHRFAIYHYRNGAYEKAVKYGLIGVSTFESEDISEALYKDFISPEKLKKVNAIDSLMVRSAYNLGAFQKRLGDFEKAIETYTKIIDLDVTPLRTAQAHAEIGYCRSKLGDFFNSALFYEQGITLFEKLYQRQVISGQSTSAATTLRTLVTQSNNMALPYYNIGTSESMAKRKRVLMRADSIASTVEVTPANLSALNMSLGNQYIYKDHFNFEKAHFYYRKCLEISLDNSYNDKAALAYNNIANLFNLIQSDSALYYIEKGLSLAEYTETKARLFDTRSDYRLQRHQPQAALNDIHRALEITLNTEIDFNEAPGILELSASELKDYAIFCLRKKSEVLIRLFKQKQENHLLYQVISNVKAADELIDLIQSGSYESETKLFWRRAAAEIYIKGIYAAHLLQQPEEMFYFIEKNRALLLSEEIATNTSFTNLPHQVSSEAQSLKKTVLLWDSKQEKNNIKSIRDSVFNAKLRFKNFTDSVKQLYPDYFNRKLAISPVTLSTWQESLKPDTAFISYAWNRLDEDNEILIGLAVDHNQTSSFIVKDTDTLKNLIKTYQAFISQPLKTQEDQQRFFELSHKLYNMLLPNAEVKAMAQSQSLSIVPDGSLQHIPFETLVTDTKSNRFLLMDTDVNYLYSVSFLRYNDQRKRIAPEPFIGYAPVKFKKNMGLVPLSTSREELNTIENKIGGEILLDQKASKAHFLKHSPHYQMIHLATHADAGGIPWIAFSEEKLQLHELYTYKNNAELVTLSACNTNLGEIAPGEGLLSLSRGFFYSGAESVMASLWSVDDQAVSSIMADFYTNLKSGQTKSAALANAKRSYLKSHSLSEQSPYYWSPVILLGGNSSIVIPEKNYSPYLVAVILAFIIFLIFLKKFFTTRVTNHKSLNYE